MSANLSALIDRMISSGVSPGEAGAIAAEIYAAGVASVTAKSSSTNAERQQRYRDRKRNETVTNRNETVTERNAETVTKNVTKRNESVTNRNERNALDSAPLTKEDKKKEERKEKREALRGTRLPETWVPNEANISYAVGKHLPSVRIEAEGRKFRNYWAAKSGQGATKVNWNLTWQNWIDNTIEREGKPNGHGSFNGARRSSGADFFAGLASVAADIVGNDPASGTAEQEIPLGRHNIEH